MKAYDPDADTPVLRAKQAVVIGGGNTAMDGVRVARRIGADPSTLVYRRSRAEIERHRGRFVDSQGDGLLLTFDGSIGFDFFLEQREFLKLAFDSNPDYLNAAHIGESPHAAYLQIEWGYPFYGIFHRHRDFFQLLSGYFSEEF